MIEIAISLAVIGFALVAIIGVLPTGMGVQKDNRHETIINEDNTVWMNAIRNGAQGLDDLTNYVMGITNVMTEWDWQGGVLRPNAPNLLTYTYTGSSNNGAATSPQYAITNGFRIIGLLTTPRMVPFNRNNRSGYYSNYVVAAVRAMSGAASEKPPQTNPDVRDLGLSYRMIVEILPHQEYDTNWVNVDPKVVSTNDIPAHAGFANFVTALQANLYDVRLTYRWPLLQNGDAKYRQVFRTMMGGQVILTNENYGPYIPIADPPHDGLFFFTPRSYAAR